MTDRQLDGRWRFEIDRLPDDAWWRTWDALNLAGCAGHPALSSKFARHLLQHFGAGVSFAEYCRGPMSAMAVVHRTGPVRCRIFQPSQAPLPLIVYRDSGQPGATILNSLLRQAGARCLALDLPCQDPEFSLIMFSELGSTEDVTEYGTTIAVSGGQPFEGYWQARPKGLRQNVARYFRRLENDGHHWRLDVITDPPAMDEAVRRYGLLESAGWKGEAGSAVHPDNIQGRFYRDLLGAFAQAGDARAYLMYVDDQLAAGRLAIQGHGMVVMLKTAFDETLARYAPGRLITYLVLNDLLQDPDVQRVEFYTKANRDALEWADSQRPLYTVTVFRNGLLRCAAQQRRRWSQRWHPRE